MSSKSGGGRGFGGGGGGGRGGCGPDKSRSPIRWKHTVLKLTL